MHYYSNIFLHCIRLHDKDWFQMFSRNLRDNDINLRKPQICNGSGTELPNDGLFLFRIYLFFPFYFVWPLKLIFKLAYQS